MSLAGALSTLLVCVAGVGLAKSAPPVHRTTHRSTGHHTPPKPEGLAPLPSIHVTTKVRSHNTLEVLSVYVGNIAGMHFSVSCNGCQRWKGGAPLREKTPTKTSRYFTGVNWVVYTGHNILLTVEHSGDVGRFVLLSVGSPRTLVYKATGCLSPSNGRPTACPQTALVVTKGTTVSGGGPVSTPTGGNAAQEEVARKAEEAKRQGEEAAAKKKAEEVAAAKKKAEEEAKKKKAEEEARETQERVEREQHEREQHEREQHEREQREHEHAETPGGEVHTWTNYGDAGGGEGPTIPAHETVVVYCRVEGFRVSDGDTWWYRIASSPWNNAYYGSADAFYNNGETSGSLIGTPFVDSSVPAC
jgi:hypothetical protein